MPLGSGALVLPAFRLLERAAPDVPEQSGDIRHTVLVVEEEYLRAPATAEEGGGVKARAEQRTLATDETIKTVPMRKAKGVRRFDRRPELNRVARFTRRRVSDAAVALGRVTDVVFERQIVTRQRDRSRDPVCPVGWTRAGCRPSGRRRCRPGATAALELRGPDQISRCQRHGVFTTEPACGFPGRHGCRLLARADRDRR